MRPDPGVGSGLLQKGDTAGAKTVLRELTRTDVAEERMTAAQRLLDSASIDGYRATQDTFSLVLTGKDPRQRIRVTQTGIEEIRPPRQP